jgi:hypothetical protein
MSQNQQYILKIFDRNNKLVDNPPDLIYAELETTTNGGSGTGYLQFARPMFDIGALDQGFRVQLFIPDPVTGIFPTDPWYDGRITKFDRLQQTTRGDIKAYVEGWMTALNFAIISEIITPGVQSNGVDNGQLDAGQYLTHLALTYLPAPPAQIPVGISFTGPNPLGINLDHLQFDGEGLASVFNDVITALVNEADGLYEWLVTGHGDGSISLVWRQDQNPNIVGTASFVTLFADEDMDQYEPIDDYTRIINTIVAYGGIDPTTGLTVWSPFTDSSSISSFGVRQGKLSVSTALTKAQLEMYALAYLNQYAFPETTGQFRLLRPDPKITAGQWIEIWETPNFVRQCKLTRVQLRIEQGRQRIEQWCYIGIPVPAVEKLAQSPDPQGSFHSARANYTKSFGVTGDFVIQGITPTWG